MASYQNVKVVNLIAGESLAADIYEIVKFENDANVAKVIKATGVTDTIIGVIAESLDATSGADGETVPVALIAAGGVLKVKAGATITAGQIIVADTTAGRVAGVTGVGALAADSMGIGIALQSAVDGDIFEMLAMPIAAPHSA